MNNSQKFYGKKIVGKKISRIEIASFLLRAGKIDWRLRTSGETAPQHQRQEIPSGQLFFNHDSIKSASRIIFLPSIFLP
jgi:hypothetical protein